MSEPFPRGSVLMELWVAARTGHALAEKALAEAGIDMDEYGFLSFVGVLQPVTRTRLSRASGLRRTTLRDVVARLIDRGHVEERPNPRDGRSTLLVLTPAGQAIFDRGLPVYGRFLATLDEALDGRLFEHEESVRRIRLALQRLAHEQGEPPETAPPAAPP
jgi:DNA-binding MarR family transcriptional regulator